MSAFEGWEVACPEDGGGAGAAAGRSWLFQDSSTDTVVQALWLNLLTLAGQLVAFSVLLRSSSMAAVLAPRLSACPEGLLLGWAKKAWRATRPMVRHGSIRRTLYPRLGNLDGAVMVRFCVLGFKFSAVGSVFCLFLVPWYVAGPGGAPPSNFNRYNLANLQEPHGGRSGRFWAVVVAAYVLTAIFLHFLLDEWKTFVEMRRLHFARLAGVRCDEFRTQSGGLQEPDPGAAQALRSVLVEHVPPAMRALDGSAVKKYFEELFPAGSVHSCVVQAETGFLYKRPEALLASASRRTLRGFRSSLRVQLRGAPAAPEPEPAAARAESDSSLRRSPRDPIATAVRDLRGLGAQARYTAGGFVDRSQQVAQLVGTVMVGGSNAGDTESGSSTAFVTFRRVADRVAAEQLLLEASPWSWHATAAPEARDVIWANAAFPLAKVRVQSLAISALLTLCLLFWSIPVASLQLYVANLTPKLLRGLLRLPVLGGQLYAFLASYVPVLALMGLMYLLPFFFDFLARHVECHKSNSTIQRRVLDTYFKYQLATLYVTVLSGSLLSSLCEVLESPATVFTILQTKVSLVACYFVNFVMARAGLSTPMLLLFPLLSLGEEDDSGEKVPVRPNYAMEASNLGMVLVLGMTYAMMAPFILPACTVFFAMSSLVYRWLFLYVYTPEFDCNGGIWYELFNGSMVGLEICTLSLAAFAALNVSASSVEFWASLLLWGAVVAVHVLLHNYYSIPSRYISLRDARDMDVACADHLHSLLREDYYIDPVIKSPPEHMFKALQLLGGRTASSCCGAPCGGRSSSDEEEEDDDEEGEPAVAHHRQTSVIVEESSGSDTASEASHRP